jgi:hypothetical protein
MFDQNDARALIHQHCNLVLRGHLHKSKSERIVPPATGRACLELAAGCVYENSDYPNAYQWIELWPGDQARARVHFRTWLDNEWIPDRNTPGATKGYADFPLHPTTPPPPTGPSKPGISPDYLAWLHTRYAAVDLLGYDPQEGRAITLEHVYVPAVTVPEHKAEETKKEAWEPDPPSPLLLERLGRQSLYLPGAPGAGKSTFCRWAVLQTGPATAYRHPVPAPDAFQETPPATLRDHLPVYVPLREFWRHIDCGRGRRDWSRTDLEQTLAAWLDKKLQPQGLDGAGLLAHIGAGSALLLLDGLDEVPISEPGDGHSDYPRALLLSGLQAALPVWKAAGNRILLTSRPYGLDEAGLALLKLTRAPLEPVPEPLQTLFIQRWFDALQQAPLASELLQDLDARTELQPLRANPMLLTALCVIYGNGKRLPQDRYELYQRIIDKVLYSRYPGDARQHEPLRARLEAIAYDMHSGDRLGAPRSSPIAECSWREVERSLQVFAEHNPAYEQGLVQPAVRREEILIRSGLLLPRSGERAAFYHLSFQEFLAAEYLFRNVWEPDKLQALFGTRGAVAEWHPTLLFLFSALVGNRNPQQGLDLLQGLSDQLSRDSVRADPSPAILVAQIIELTLAKDYRLPKPMAAGFRDLCLTAIEDEIPVQARLSLGRWTVAQ